MLTLKTKMLNLMFEDEIVATIRDGGVLNYDGIYLSPARAGGDVGEGYSLVAAPPANIDPPSKEQLLNYAADVRWDKENSGISLMGFSVATDDRSKLMLSGARIAATADPDFTTRWKTPGGWVDLTAAQIIAISDAVQAHVSECFALEADVADQIEAGTILSEEDIDDLFRATHKE